MGFFKNLLSFLTYNNKEETKKLEELKSKIDDLDKISPIVIDIPPFETKPKAQNPLLIINDLNLFPPEEPTASPEKKILATGSGEKMRVASLWNNYGLAIEHEAKLASLDPTIALAIFSVESGRAYDNDTGLVIIRFEPHVFKRYTKQDVLAPHTSQKAEWESFINAYKINSDAAIKSTSYGLPQLMGFNFGVTNHTDPKSLLLAFQRSCREQIAGFFGFVKKNGLEEKARKEDFVGFARKYNGIGKEELYAKKMRNFLSHARDLLK